MRPRLLTALGITALALTAPAAALAEHGNHDARGHHHHHRAEHHHARGKAHHANVRFVHLGAPPVTSQTGTGSPPQPPTTPPIAPANAATVASYTGGVLTLTLADGSSLSGEVTNATRIRCIVANPPVVPVGEGQQGNRGPGDDNGQGDDRSGGDMDQHDGSQWSGSKGQGHNGEDDNQQQAAGEAPCDSSALVSGTGVRAAELRIGPLGSEFESIELVR